MSLLVGIVFLLGSGLRPGFAAEPPPRLGISANPSAVDRLSGSGEVADWFGLKEDAGVFLGGVWIGNSNYVISGGEDPGGWSFNSLLNISMGLDAEKLVGLKGGNFGIEFLQFNGQHSNAQAGSAQGYDGLPGAQPYNRTELYQLWWRQELFDGKLIVRVGKMNAAIDFNNVQRPVTTRDGTRHIPSVSGLIYTPLFKNPTLIGVLAGGYNSACGVVTTIAPTDNTYLSYGFFDGSGVNGVQTGRNGPQFNGSYFHIGEAGMAWEIGRDRLPGSIGAGVWYQTGLLEAHGITETGAGGVYLFGSQRLWLRNPNQDNSGVSAYFQFGENNSDVLPFNQYFGMGLTAFALVPQRPQDSFGAGLAWSWLNPREFERPSELMFQAYYQAHFVAGTYLQPVLSYIPTPGAGADLPPAWVVTMQITVLF